MLVYAHGTHAPSSWGFLAETAQEQSGAGHESREWFKIMLDEHLLEQMRKVSSDPSKVPQLHEVEKWYGLDRQYCSNSLQARTTGTLITSNSSIVLSNNDSKANLPAHGRMLKSSTFSPFRPHGSLFRQLSDFEGLYQPLALGPTQITKQRLV